MRVRAYACEGDMRQSVKASGGRGNPLSAFSLGSSKMCFLVSLRTVSFVKQPSAVSGAPLNIIGPSMKLALHTESVLQRGERRIMYMRQTLIVG